MGKGGIERHSERVLSRYGCDRPFFSGVAGSDENDRVRLNFGGRSDYVLASQRVGREGRAPTRLAQAEGARP